MEISLVTKFHRNTMESCKVLHCVQSLIAGVSRGKLAEDRGVVVRSLFWVQMGLFGALPIRLQFSRTWFCSFKLPSLMVAFPRRWQLFYGIFAVIRSWISMQMIGVDCIGNESYTFTSYSWRISLEAAEEKEK